MQRYAVHLWLYCLRQAGLLRAAALNLGFGAVPQPLFSFTRRRKRRVKEKRERVFSGTPRTPAEGGSPLRSGWKSAKLAPRTPAEGGSPLRSGWKSAKLAPQIPAGRTLHPLG